MLAEDTRRRQEKLKQYLFAMSDKVYNDQEINDCARKFKELYSNNFRHNYSDFFPIILNISKDDNDHNLDYLSNNLESLRVCVEEDYTNKVYAYSGLYKNLEKLCDHLNLEISRLNYYSINEDRISDVDSKTKRLNIDLKEALQEVKSAREQTSSIQTEVIAVLSIFSAVIIAFFGGMSFIGNALSSMQDTYIFKSILIILVCGLILSNVIFLLMYLVGKITNRNIYAKCKTSNCTCKEGKPKCLGINRIRKRLPYVFYLNLMIIILLIADVALWILTRYGIILPLE